MKQPSKLFLYAALVCGNTLLAGQAHAALLLTVDTAGCTTNVAINNAIGQSFRVNAATSLEKLEVWIKPELYYTTSYALELYDGEGTSGGLLGTSSTTVTLGSQTGGTPSGFQAFSFANLGLSLQPSHAYTFRLVRLSQYSGAFAQCGNVYAGGNQYWLGYSVDSSRDLAFRLYGTQASAPGARALLLEGSTGSHVHVGSLSIPANFTLEAWVRPNSSGLYQAILTKEQGCVGGNQFRLQLDPANKAAFLMTDAAAEDGGLFSGSWSYKLQSSSALPLSSWSHVAVTKNGNVFTLYVNGSPEATYTTSMNVLHSGTQPFMVGSRISCSGTSDGAFDGMIDEVRVWSIARTQADIAANMSRPLFPSNPAWPGLKAYWRLDEGANSVARDEKNAYPGTLVNGPVWFIAN